MFIRLILVIGLSSLLFGCSSDEVKEEDPVQVEDRSSAATSGAAEDSGAQAYGTDDGSTSGFSELDDPQSPLSVRIIYFEYDSSEIRSEYRSVIEAHAAYLIRNPSTTITLEGHADERGSREYNLALGERRAQSIRQQMALLGVASSQIRLVSYGEERPAVEGHDEASWQQNRRVEILY
ncbi:MAG: peptidoglycan-associated lipoprotein Pal [Proteobacteria bacterium]|nr:peptidoglycan-associated lipoprotein Pal [Pseudomonadota bacterium]